MDGLGKGGRGVSVLEEARGVAETTGRDGSSGLVEGRMQGRLQDNRQKKYQP